MDFWKLLFRFVPIYKWRILAYIVLNILCSVFSIFSFATIIPLLQVLFGLSKPSMSFVDWETISSFSSALDVIKNNTLFYIQGKIISNGDSAALLLIGMFLIITSFLSNAISLSAYFVRIPVRTGIARDLRKVVYAKIVKMPLSTFKGESKGDFVARMTSDVEEVDFGIGTAMDMLIKDPVQIIVYIVTLFGISIALTWRALFLLAISCTICALVGSAMKRFAMKVQTYKGQIMATFEESIGALPIIKAFNIEHRLEERFSVLNNKIREMANTANRRYSFAWPLADFLMTTIIAILLWFGGRAILDGQSSIGTAEFIYFLVVFYSTIPPIRDITKCTFGIRKAMASVERMNRIAKLEDESNSYTPLTPSLHTQIGSPIINFNNVCFAYGKQVVFQNFNISIKQGEHVAIIGHNGSGKSTFASILMNFYNVQSGHIAIDNVPICDWNLKQLRNLFAYVPQEAMLFNDTIYSNIALGKDDVTIQEIEQVIEALDMKAFINSCPQGLYTKVGNQGMELSGGQRQCIAIARALISNAPILLFDEATSALDQQNLSSFNAYMKQCGNQKTIICITHDTNALSFIDRVIDLDSCL